MTTYRMITKGRVKVIQGILGISLGLVLTIPLPVKAIPQLPERFQGRITINGIPAPTGVEVTTTINGITEVFSAITDVQGNYSLLYVKGDNPDTAQAEGGNNGDTVRFFVGGAYAGTNTFNSGDSHTLNLNINILLGDANADDTLNALDITKIERMLAKIDLKYIGSDTNLDGSYNVLDISKLERLIAHLD